MASVVFVRFAIEAIHPSLRKKIVSIYSNNSPTVSWVQRQASGQSRVAAQLLRALALRMKLARSSPITATHIAGKDNVFADIPSRSFGSNTNWHCISDSDFLHFYNGTFPLPQQNFWTLYRHISKICTSFFFRAADEAFRNDQVACLSERSSVSMGTLPPTCGIGPIPSNCQRHHQSSTSHRIRRLHLSRSLQSTTSG